MTAPEPAVAPRAQDDAVGSFAIRATGLRKRFGSVTAVDGIVLDVPRGACFGLVGANGAGKTTFIKMMLGITRPDAGSVTVLGGSPDDVQVRRRIGYLPERLTIPDAFSARRFLFTVGRMRGLSAAMLKDETPRVLELVQLERAAWDRRTGGYSKGMKQRTGLAAALLGKPELLVLDEPTDGIDPMGRVHIRELILEACKSGTTVFLNSHLLAESEKLCDHVAVLSQGRVVRSGALDLLKRKDAVRVRFLKHTDDIAIAARHGFVHVSALTHDATKVDEARTFRIEAHSEQAVSAALNGALGDGLVVVELSRELKDLETILKESIQ